VQTDTTEDNLGKGFELDFDAGIKLYVSARVQQPKLEDYDDEEEDDIDDAAEMNTDENGVDGPTPTKTRRQTFDGPVLPLDADSTFALPGTCYLDVPYGACKPVTFCL